MGKKVAAGAGKTASAKPKSAMKGASAPSAATIQGAIRLTEDLIRERAYGIWIAEGRPHGRDLAHWQRAKHELQHEAR